MVKIKKKSSGYYKELSGQMLQSSLHPHVPPTDLRWIAAVAWRSCVCVVLSISCNPRALWVASPWPVLLPGAMPLGTGFWSHMGCIWAVSQEIRTGQILKCPLFVFSFPSFSAFPIFRFFSWQFNYSSNSTCHSSHQVAPTQVEAKQFFVYFWVLKNKASITAEGWR